jgi:hypothetical protein
VLSLRIVKSLFLQCDVVEQVCGYVSVFGHSLRVRCVLGPLMCAYYYSNVPRSRIIATVK